MPTWLPSLPLVAGSTSYPPQQANWTQHIVATDGTSYGWTRAIAYFLFERIQILQDAVLLQDISGDSLFFLAGTNNTNNQYYLDAAQTGLHDGTARQIAAAATPGMLRLQIPWPGCQGRLDGGFPLYALKGQGFKLRVTLRKPEQLWESDVATAIAPWLQTFNVPLVGGGSLNVQGCGRAELVPPTILLETTQAYLPDPIVRSLVDMPIEMPFIQYFDYTFTIGGADYAALQSAGVALKQLRMEGRHPMERLLFIFRLQQWLEAGQRWRTDGQQFYNTLSLQIAGKVREFEWEPPVWNDIQALIKDDRSANRNTSEMRWNIRPAPDELWLENRQPTGTVNFTTASRPTFAINLADVPANPRTGEKNTLLQVCGESWAQYIVTEGRGLLKFVD
jgi:hypothetical protein